MITLCWCLGVVGWLLGIIAVQANVLKSGDMPEEASVVFILLSFFGWPIVGVVMLSVALCEYVKRKEEA